MPFYIFTRAKNDLAVWELIETAKTATSARRAAAAFRQLCRAQNDFEVVTIIADNTESAKQKLALDAP